MTPPRLSAPILIATLALGVLMPAHSALACSVGPDYDPIAASEVIVEGRITSWEFIDHALRPTGKEDPPDDPDYYGPYDAIRIDMQVARIYKGSVSEELTMVAGNTVLKQMDGSVAWVGTSGACGAFDADPTNGWFVLGLSTDNWGRYHPSLLKLFYVGDDPSGTAYTGSVERLAARLGPASLPNGGGPPDKVGIAESDLPVYIILPAAFLVPLAVLFIWAFVIRPKGGGH